MDSVYLLWLRTGTKGKGWLVVKSTIVIDGVI
jgi:hypothetical protein